MAENSSRRSSSRLKRKREATQEEDDDTSGAPASKTPHVSTTSWEWHSDSGWTAFEPTHAATIEKAFKQKKSELVLQVSATKTKFKIQFGTMTQANLATGWRRDIRCISPSSASSSTGSGGGSWDWKDEHEKWNSYAPDVCRLLDACRLCNVDEWQITACGRSYRVELKEGTPKWGQINVETGVRRDIRYKGMSGGMAGGTGSAASAHGASAAATSSSNEGDSKAKGATSTGKSKRGKRKGKKTEEEAAGSEKEAEGATVKEEEATDSRVLVTYRGKVPVDYECREKIGKAHVYCDSGEHWDATLNQTNLKNNNNKFYILQLLKDNSANKYSVWFRWGRVGKPGQHSLFNCGSDIEEAKHIFSKKFQDKTLNSWDNRSSFVKHEGKYDLLAMDYETKEETDEGDGADSVKKEDDEDSSSKPSPVESTLDKRLQSLIELVCDIQAMEDTVVEMKYDAKKAPLGKLTADQVKSGYTALKKIEACINKGDFGDNLVKACNDFYTRIPHCFGMKRPPLIRTKADVKEKIALLETLSDIQIALKVLHEGDKKEHPIDRHYHSLHCDLVAVDKEDEVFGIIEKYVRQTHASTHSQYKLEVQEVFVVDREGEARDFKDMGNRQLLWHGSRLSNWVGILSQGLRIAPPEAPMTGYMFGKGIYFADMCSKSANYCFATKSKNEGVAILCDVSLGTPQELLGANYSADELPKGRHSTKGLGSVAPDPAQNVTLDGCTVPLGTAINTGVKNPSGYTLNYNEYIVYDPNQVKMKYLVRMKFHYN